MDREESRNLLSDAEKADARVEVYEVIPVVEEQRRCRKRPLWRRILRCAMTFFLVSFIVTTVIPAVVRPFSGCRHMGPLHKVKFDPNLPSYTPSASKPKKHFEFKEDIDHFFIKQDTQKRIPSPRTDVRGSVTLTSYDGDKPTVDFDIKVSDDKLWDYIKIQPQEKGIYFSADPWSFADQHVDIIAHVKIPEKMKLKGLYAGTRELNIMAKWPAGEQAGKVGFETVSGNIETATDEEEATYGDWTKLRTVSGKIKGGFGLYKGLDVATASGNIDIHVFPQEREDTKAYLKTKTVSGTTKVHVVHPQNARAIRSSHASVSGEISARYPEEWQGKMKLTTTSGAFNVIGKNVKVIKKKKSIKGVYWKITKGEGSSFGRIKSVSGNVNLSIGDHKDGDDEE